MLPLRKQLLVVRTLGLAALVSLLAVQGEPQPLDQSSALRDFASWREVTAGPYHVPEQLWTLCMPPVGPPPAEHPGRPVATGADLFIRVYANPAAYPLMKSPRGPQFPAGSILAKAKLVRGESHPVGVAFMIKHEAGYNPAALDWEFVFFEGDPLRQVAMDAGAASCAECHGSMKEGDGVFGSYLPDR